MVESGMLLIFKKDVYCLSLCQVASGKYFGHGQTAVVLNVIIVTELFGKEFYAYVITVYMNGQLYEIIRATYDVASSFELIDYA